jgi:hypothetical protein
VRAAILAVLLAAAVALTGCGPERSAPERPAPAGVSPAEVQEQEDAVDDIERVVGSAEAEVEAEAGNDG